MARSTMDTKVGVIRLAGSLGAEISNVNLQQLSAESVAEIEDLLHEHLVLFFPEQFLDVGARGDGASLWPAGFTPES